MGWADSAIEKLKRGESVKINPRGNSMQPLINSGDCVELAPITRSLNIGDIVLCKVKGSQYLHKIKAIGQDGRYLIQNNRGFENGWTSTIYGVLIENHTRKPKI